MTITRSAHEPRHLRRRVRGVTLVELMVGLVISSVILVGTVFVYSQSRSTYGINEKQARLQEFGRYVTSVIEPDLQLAGYFGFSNSPTDLRYRDGGNEYPTSQLEQADAKIVNTPVAIHTCGNNFAIDLLASVQGTNNVYTGIACAATGGYQAGTDTLTIRRASTAAATSATGARIQLYVNELKHSNQYIFSNTTAPGVLDSTRQVRDLIVRMYYVSQQSDASLTTPSLRRKFLTTVAGAPAIADEEILPGVEDMQVQFGIDTGDHDGVAGIDADEDANGVPDNPNGVVSRWVDPDDAMLKAPAAGGRKAQVVAVRMWLRIRSDEPDPLYTDNRTYTYGAVSYTPSGDAVRYRRTIVSRTVFLRNARTL